MSARRFGLSTHHFFFYHQPKFKETTFKAERNSSMMMSTERCGFLIAVAIANNLSEVWICKGLVLLLMQMYQWCPLMTRW